MKFWIYFIILIINNLLILLLTTQLFGFEQSLNDTICINRSGEIIVLDIARIESVHGEAKVTYNVTSNNGAVGDGKRINLIFKDDDVFELHINGNATLGNRSTLKLVVLLKDDLMLTSDPLTDSTKNGDISEETHHNLQEPIKHSYDFKTTQFVNEFNNEQQQEYQFINPELGIQSFERNLQDQSVLKRKRRASVYSTRGSEYYIGFIPLFGVLPSLTILSGSEKLINYSLEAPVTELYETGTIMPNGTETVNLPNTLSGVSHFSPFCRNNSFKEGLYLQASSDEITVIGTIREDKIEFNFDTFFALPIKDFCIDEYTYFAISVDTFVAADGSIVIVGTANQTSMSISVSTSAFIKPNNFDDWEPLEPGTSYNFTIDRLEIMYIAAFTTDLTGTKVTTNKPISLFSGHECAFIPYEVHSCDHLAEQIPPTELWGTVHYFAPLANRTSYMIKIVAANDSTTVNIYCNDTFTSDVIDAGEFINITYDYQEFCGVYADNKVLVAQFSLSFDTDSQGDPMMTLIPATSHYTDSITSSTFNTSSERNISYSHYINIIVLADYFQPEMISITTKGMNRSLDLETWEPIVRDNVTEAYGAQVAEMPDGIFHVAHSNKLALMTVVVYGFTLYLDTVAPNRAEGYGHPGWLMDQFSIVVSLEESEYLVAEDDLLSVTITMNDEPSHDFMVEVTITDETARAGMDYNVTASVFNVTISAGAISSSFNIDINDDVTHEDNETFNVTIKLVPTARELSLCISSSTVTIIDHDEINICFNESSVFIMEDQESAIFLPALSNPSSHDITIIVDSTDGTAIGGDDYEPGPFNVTIPAGEISVPFNISITDDNVFEGNRSFNLIIHSKPLLHRLSLQPDCMLIVTIVDDDALTVRFDNETYTAYENDGMVQLVLVLSDPSPFAETVQVMNTDITADAGGIDYNSGPYNVTFPIGSTNVSFYIIINGDNVLEDDEMFNVSIYFITNDHIVGTPEVATVTIIDTTSKKTSSITATVTGGTSGGAVLLILLAVLIVMCCVLHIKKKKKKHIWNDRVFFSKSSICVINQSSLDGDRRDSRRESSVYLFDELKKQHETCLIDNGKLFLEEKIAKGNFGVVYKGWYEKESMQVRVAIKILIDVSSTNAKQFIKECVLTNQFDHPNVLSLIGVCINVEEATIQMVMPFMHHGDVRTYLRAKRGSVIEFDRFPEDVHFDLLMNMCLEIAKGMEYLSSLHFVHRDLAARNCMLDENMCTKVADFGLSRDVYMSNYYMMSQKVPLPVKWLAPEALMDKVFSENTDVWAFGVTCWEIFSLGLQPYPSVDPHDMSDYLKSRKLLEKPSLCSDEFYNIMKSCWRFKPEDRPNFAMLVQNVNEQIKQTEQQRYKQLTSSYLRVY